MTTAVTTPAQRQVGRRPAHRGRVRWRGYGAAVLLVAVALLVTLLLERLVQNSVSPLFFVAVMVSAWYGGLGPGLLATALSVFACAYFFMGPSGSLLIGMDDVLRLAVFLPTAVLVSSLTASRRRAERTLRLARDELEDRVRERTAELTASNASLQLQIEERRRVEAALRQAEERFRLVIEGVADHAIFMLDPQARVVSWNPGAARISGWSEEEIAGSGFDRFFPADDARRGDAGRAVEAAAASGKFEAEGWRMRKDRSMFWADESVTALRDEAGVLRGFAVVLRDVTERKRLELAVLEASEREQRRIGHDLHDGLGQQLTGLAFRSKMLEHNLATRSPADAEEARQVAALINQTIRHARDLAHGLAPVNLDAEGLCPALRQLAGQGRELFGIAFEVEADPTVPVADDSAAAHLYRIAQEAINNAVKHGRARRVTIRLGDRDGRPTLSVRDDGVGFDPARAQRGMGLELMSYRARMIGGALDVRPGTAGGTVVTCTWRAAAAVPAGAVFGLAPVAEGLHR